MVSLRKCQCSGPQSKPAICLSTAFSSFRGRDVAWPKDEVLSENAQLAKPRCTERTRRACKLPPSPPLDSRSRGSSRTRFSSTVLLVLQCTCAASTSSGTVYLRSTRHGRLHAWARSFPRWQMVASDGWRVTYGSECFLGASPHRAACPALDRTGRAMPIGCTLRPSSSLPSSQRRTARSARCGPPRSRATRSGPRENAIKPGDGKSPRLRTLTGD